MEQLNSIIESSKKYTVLYVEDQEDVRLHTVVIFKHFFKEVFVAVDGVDGLKKYKENKPDIVITDIMMPRKNGLELINDIKAIDISQVILVVSAYNDSHYLIKAIENSVDGYILKPLNTQHLLNTLQRVIQILNERKENNEYRNYLEQMVEEKTEKLKQKLVVDDLTGLRNSLSLKQELEKLDEAIVLLINLDSFKHINTTYGYYFGNKILKVVAKKLDEILDKCENKNAKLFRFMSDEFIFLCDESKSIDDLKEFINVLQDSIFNQEIVVDDIELNISASFVIVEGKASQLLQQAEIAMFESKNIGKNRVTVFTEDMETTLKQKQNIFWMNKVRYALKNNCLLPFFQPILDNVTMKIEKYESLARIIEDNNVVVPSYFIEPARLVGLLPNITQSLLKYCFELFSKNHLSFTVNISGDDFKNNSLLYILTNYPTIYNLDPSRVTLEVLEDISVYGSNEILEQLKYFKSLGYKIALDDFGAENANFSRILDLDADCIKIDGQFIKNIHIDKKSYLITESIVSLAKKMNIKTVAEFVHSKEVFDVVRELGIDYSQGYYISEPKLTLFTKE
ncbi:MAG: EAL domain-containing protein [Campylobacterales bacterium]|nr:EAL domain-containing protein [Campylobacterales bacterium]